MLCIGSVLLFFKLSFAETSYLDMYRMKLWFFLSMLWCSYFDLLFNLLGQNLIIQKNMLRQNLSGAICFSAIWVLMLLKTVVWIVMYLTVQLEMSMVQLIITCDLANMYDYAFS